nr:amino acid adenylation domain-containing protein [Streptomyces coryli]
MSYEQESIWLNDQLQDGASRYVESWNHWLSGPVDHLAVEEALTGIVARHATLRSRLAMADGEPVQQVLPPMPVRVDKQSVTADELDAALREAVGRPLPLNEPPLLQATLLHTGPAEAVLVVRLHHAVVDGWCFRLLDLEFSERYRAAVAGRPPQLPELPTTFTGYAAAQRRRPAAELEELLAHWREVLDGAPRESAIPAPRPRPEALSHRGGQTRFRISAQLAEQARRLARDLRTTPFSVFATALSGLVARWSGQDDVVIGTPISRRDEPELEPVIACLTDVLPLRHQLPPAAPFAEHVTATQQSLWEAIACRDIPFGHLVNELDTDRTLARFPLFQIVLTVDDAAAPGLDLPGIEAERLHLHNGTAKFDLFLHLVPDGDGGYLGLLEYATDLYEAADADRIATGFTTLLADAVAHPRWPLSDLETVSEADRRLVRGWARGPDHAAEPPLVHQAVTRRARSTPDTIAVTDGTRAMTYQELDTASDALAAHLAATGIRPGDRVAVSVTRSPEMPVAVLAVAKAGGCVVPIDPGYPAARADFMLADSDASMVLTHSGLADRFAASDAVTVVALDELPPPPAGDFTPPETAGDDLLYLIYTSGSTGTPKGVPMPHRSLASLTAWQQQRSGAARTLQFAPLSFDVAFQELFATLAAGGTLVLAGEEERRDPERLLDLLTSQRVERLFLPFVALQQLAEYATAARKTCPVPEVITAGEQLHITPAIRAFFAGTGAVLENQYGPSETHVVTAHRLTGDPATWPERPPIGRVVDGARVYVLDRHLNPMPPGLPGEICIAGGVVAEGYHRRPEKSAHKFRGITGPYRNRLYRSGDLGRFLPDGTLEFLGRADSQVKIRGFRVEPAETEAALRRLPGIADAAVVAAPAPTGGLRLAGHYVGDRLDPAALRDALAERLPEHLVPQVLVAHDRFPLTPSGKLDRKALAGHSAGNESSPSSIAWTPQQQPVVDAWQLVLGAAPAAPEADFFAAGGDSLTAVRLVLALKDATGIRLPMNAVFSAPTVTGLSARLAVTTYDDAPTLATDAQLPAHIQPAAQVAPMPADPGLLLLTGATGFLGAHLLQQLLTGTRATVACLVRAATELEGHDRIVAALRRYDLWQPSWAGRIRALPADLAAPRLGLTDERFHRLAQDVDAVYHCGAAVNLAHAYPQLRAANVTGTAEILHLAAAHRTVPMHHVSTVGVLTPTPGITRIGPDTPLPPPDGLQHGYAQSKWAAEALINQARERGLPVTVYRPTRISANSTTGICQEGDFFWLLLKSCVEAGIAPTDAGLAFDLVPVDYTAAAIVRLSTQQAAANRTFHLAGERHLHLRTAVDWLRARGHRIEAGPAEAWAARIEERQLPTGLALLATFRTGTDAEGTHLYDAATTRALLPDLDCPPFDAAQFHACADHFTATGFLPAADPAR